MHDHSHENCHCHEDHAQDKYQQAFAKHDMHLHDELVTEQVRRLVAENSSKYDTPEVMRQLLAAVELTTLKVTDSEESVLALVERVNKFYAERPDVPPVATICVYPRFAKIVSQSLEVEDTAACVVSGAFPSSQTFAEVKTVETALAVHDGAEEVDCVLSVGTFLSGDYETCADEISELKAACDGRPLKVILETGALQTALNIKKASVLAIYAGADFIKTSTGKITPAATPEAALVMCQAIREYYDQTGVRIGFKAAGGLQTVDDALAYFTIVREILGEEWIKEGLFRLGTSRLANLLVQRVTGEDIKPF